MTERREEGKKEKNEGKGEGRIGLRKAEGKSECEGKRQRGRMGFRLCPVGALLPPLQS